MTMNSLRSVTAAAVVLFMVLQAQRVCAVEVQGGTVSGGKHLSVTFIGAGKPYGIVASAASGWEFRDATHISNTLNWYPDPGHNNHNRWGKTRDDSSDNNNELFSVRIWGKIVPVGTGTGPGEGPPPPTDWSVKGKMAGDYEINPEELVLHVSETGSFTATMGSQQVNSNWELVALDGTWHTRFDSGNPILNVGPDGDFQHPFGRYLVTGIDASNESQSDTAALVIYRSNLTFKKSTPICATTSWSEVDEEDCRNYITLRTEPDGYSDYLELKILSATPENADNGILEGSGSSYTYTALTEDVNDRWPGDDELRVWQINFASKVKSTGFTYPENGRLFVRSVFTYCTLNKSDYPAALEYVKWKYRGALAGITVGTYWSLWSWENYGEAWIGGIVFYGNSSFQSENTLLSTIFHENIHVNQPFLLKSQGVADRTLYVIGGNPEPPTLPQPGSEGKEWAIMEWPAYNEENNKAAVSGIDQHHDAYIQQLNGFVNFFTFLLNNAD